MPREVWLGPILNDNRERIVARCRDLLRSGRAREFVYLAATKPLMESVTLALLDGDVAGTSDPINVYLLSGFSRRVFAKAVFADTGEPLPFFAPIDTDARPVQRPLFSRLISRLAEGERLKSFGQLARTEGLVSSMAALVAEIQRAGKTAPEFRDAVRRREALDAESKPARAPRDAGAAPEAAAEVEPGAAPGGEPGDASGPDASRAREARRIASIDYDLDTALVYEEYERVLDENLLTDASRDYLRALEVLGGEFLGRPVRVPILEEARLLVVDGFFDILPVHAELLSVLVRRFPETIVNLNFDRRNPDAYRAFRDVVERFGERVGFEERYTASCATVAAPLRPLRIALFNTAAEEAPSPAEEGEEPAAVLLEAADRVREVRAVAKEIKRLVIEEGFAPHEIAVVARDRERYEPYVREVFADEAVALSLGERRALTDLPAARAAMKVLDAAVSNQAREGRRIRVGKLVAILKSDYFALAPDAAGREQPDLPFPVEAEPTSGAPLTPDEVENAVAFVGAELHLDDWLRRAHRLIARLADPGDLARFDEAGDAPDGDAEAKARRARARAGFPVATLRKAAGTLEALGEIVCAIPHEAPAADLAAAFRAALARLSFAPRLAEAARRAALDETALRRAALDLRALEGLERAVDAVAEASRLAAGVESPRRAAGDTRLARAEFRADLQRAMDAHAIPVTQEVEGAVRMLAATDMRGMRFAAVFVLGLVEGEFPERARGDWIYPQHERETFREVGLPLEDISPEESLRNEEHYFYQTVCRATRRLYLSRPLAGDSDAETIASQFVGEVERALGPGGLVTRRVPAGFEGETLLEATTPGELARAVARAERAVAERPDRCPAPRSVVEALGAFAREERAGWPAALSSSALRRAGVERAREAAGFDEFDGLVRDRELRRLLRAAYSAHTFSASELNEFADCGFRFFLRRVLGVTPRVEAALDLQALDRGILLHDVLRRFFERYRGVRLHEVPPGELRLALAAACDEVFDRHESGMPPLNPKLWRIERQTLAILLERVLDDEVETQRRLGSVAVRHLEIAFGMPKADSDPRSASEPLALSRRPVDGRDETILLRGQIDRVDATGDGRLIAYDYKTSQGPRVADMEKGLDMQLGIYLEAIEQLFLGEGETVAGGGYYSLKPVAARRNNGLYRADMNEVTGVDPRCRSNLNVDVWRDLRRTIVRAVFAAYDRVRDGDFRVAPAREESSCAHCDYQAVCRYDRQRIRAKRRADSSSARPERVTA